MDAPDRRRCGGHDHDVAVRAVRAINVNAAGDNDGDSRDDCSACTRSTGASTSADHNNCGARHSQNGDTAASGATNTTGDATGARGETGGG